MLGIIRTGADTGRFVIGPIFDATPFALTRAYEVSEALRKLWDHGATAVLLPRYKATLSRDGDRLRMNIRAGIAPSTWISEPDFPGWAAKFLALVDLDVWGRDPDTRENLTPARAAHFVPMRYQGTATGPYMEALRALRGIGATTLRRCDYDKILALCDRQGLVSGSP